MKENIILKIIIIALAIISFASCTDDKYAINNEPIATYQSKQDTLRISMQKMPVYYNGVRDSCLESLDTSNFISIFFDTAIYYFDNDSLLYEFCKSINKLSVFFDNEKLDLIHKKSVELGLNEKVVEVPNEMNDYWVSVFGCPFGYMHSSMTGDSKLALVVNAFDDLFCMGAQKNCFGPTYYNLGDFNRKTSSFYVGHVSLLGGIFWCHRTWYGRPRAIYLLTLSPYLEVDVLQSQHNNKFCSYVSTIH